MYSRLLILFPPYFQGLILTLRWTSLPCFTASHSFRIRMNIDDVMIQGCDSVQIGVNNDPAALGMRKRMGMFAHRIFISDSLLQILN